MKKIFNFNILILLSATMFLISCEINDPIDNVVRVGQVAPHVYWELPSNSVTAGAPVSFYAQYYAVGDKKIDRLEVWYDVNEYESKVVSCPLVTTFKYSISANSTTLSREYQEIVSFKHKESNWNALKKAYILDTIFPTSRTLRTVEWKEVKTFDPVKFAAYFPVGFDTHFKDSLYNLLKVSDFRKIMVSLNVMTTVEFVACTDSTFNLNSGSYDYFIKTEKKPELKTKYDAIPFKDLIYDSSAQIYKVEYTRLYKLNARFKGYDTDNVAGVTDKKEIELR